MPFDIKKPGDKASRFAAMREAAIAAAKAPPPVDPSTPKTQEMIRRENLIPAGDCVERIRIIFDDSYSMNGSAVKDAREGVVEFLRSCIPGQTSVGIDLLNAPKEEGEYSYQRRSGALALPSLLQKGELTSDLILLASAVDSIEATGGTPLFQTLLYSLNQSPSATRLIAFTDGEADSDGDKEAVISKANFMKVPIDTVYIANQGRFNSTAASQLREVAERTGGIFLDFSKGGSASFKNAFKYLAPVNRLQLMSGSLKDRLEGK